MLGIRRYRDERIQTIDLFRGQPGILAAKDEGDRMVGRTCHFQQLGRGLARMPPDELGRAPAGGGTNGVADVGEGLVEGVEKLDFFEVRLGAMCDSSDTICIK